MFLDVRKVIIGEGIFIIGATLVALGFLFLPLETTPLVVLLVMLTVIFCMLGLVLAIYGIIYTVTKGVITRHIVSPLSFGLTILAALVLGVAWVSLAWFLAPWHAFPVNPDGWWFGRWYGDVIYLSATTFLIFGCVQIALGILIFVESDKTSHELSK